MRASTREVLVGGLYTGVIGYGAVVVSMAVLNMLLGRSPFYTAALLGSSLFYGGASAAIVPGPILAYNMLHLLVFLALGGLASLLVELAERFPSVQYLILVLLVFVAFHVYAAMLLFSHPLMGPGAWWEIGIGTLAAAVAMGWYLARRHPLLRRELRELPMGEVPPTA